MYSQILFACVRLKLFELLAEGPLTADQIAARLAVPLDSTERLLEAAVSLHLVERRPLRSLRAGRLGAALVGNPAVGAMVEHHTSALRGPARSRRLAAGRAATDGTVAGTGPTRPATSWRRSAPDACSTDYTTLMSSSQPLVSDEILDAYPLGRHRCLLDVGGGDGSFLIEAAKRHAHLHWCCSTCRPWRSAREQRFAALGLGSRARAIAGDFLTDPLPAGADVVSLVRVVHDHDDDAAMALLRAAAPSPAGQGRAAAGRTHDGNARCRTRGGCLFRVLSAGDGSRAPAHAANPATDAASARASPRRISCAPASRCRADSSSPERAAATSVNIN